MFIARKSGVFIVPVKLKIYHDFITYAWTEWKFLTYDQHACSKMKASKVLNALLSEILKCVNKYFEMLLMNLESSKARWIEKFSILNI